MCSDGSIVVLEAAAKPDENQDISIFESKIFILGSPCLSIASITGSQEFQLKKWMNNFSYVNTHYLYPRSTSPIRIYITDDIIFFSRV